MLEYSGGVSMRIAVFGATGGTGREIVRQALDAGIEINALVRDPAKLPGFEDTMSVVKGDILDSSVVSEVIRGTGAVLSAIGASNLGPTTLYSRSIEHIIAGMEHHGVRRIVCVGAVGIDTGTDRNIPLIGRLIIRLVLQNVLLDMRAMQERLAETDLDWTVMWPPRLNNGPLTGEYRTEIDRAVRTGRVISRSDLAHYMIHHIEADENPRKVAIAY
jgi:putative NADH-flavin reductase